LAVSTDTRWFETSPVGALGNFCPSPQNLRNHGRGNLLRFCLAVTGRCEKRQDPGRCWCDIRHVHSPFGTARAASSPNDLAQRSPILTDVNGWVRQLDEDPPSGTVGETRQDITPAPQSRVNSVTVHPPKKSFPCPTSLVKLLAATSRALLRNRVPPPPRSSKDSRSGRRESVDATTSLSRRRRYNRRRRPGDDGSSPIVNTTPSPY